MSDELDSPRELPFPSSNDELLAMPGVLSALALSTDTPSGWCPFAIRHATPNFWSGHVDRLAVCDHVTDAAWASVVSWFKNPASERSAHFQIRKDGTIDQFVSIHDSAWANGASWSGQSWVDPQGHLIRPTWPLMTPPVNPNRRTISVEHEGHPADSWTAAQKAADTKLNRWLATQYVSLAPYVAGRTLIRHADISPISKPNCPGPHVDLVERAAAANGATPVDPLRAATIAGPNGLTFYCSVACRDYWRSRGSLTSCGYALGDETRGMDAGGRVCTVMRFERVLFKATQQYGIEQCLLDEALRQGWLPCLGT